MYKVNFHESPQISTSWWMYINFTLPISHMWEIERVKSQSTHRWQSISKLAINQFFLQLIIVSFLIANFEFEEIKFDRLLWLTFYYLKLWPNWLLFIHFGKKCPQKGKNTLAKIVTRKSWNQQTLKLNFSIFLLIW